MANDTVINVLGGDTGNLNTATLNSAGAWTNASDVSYKENITDLNNGLSILLNLSPRRYNMKGSNVAQVGFIAQEVETFLPEVVSGQDGRKGISYGNLGTLTVAAVKDLATLLKITSEDPTASSSPLASIRLDEIEARIKAIEEKQAGGGGGVVTTITNTLASITEWAGEKITAEAGEFRKIMSWSA